jgi:tRNA (guanine10-N2)-dimethyltransferase
MQSIIILGRQPSLGVAELESLYGADMIRPIADYAVGLEQSVDDIAFARLGGAVKLCRVLTTINSIEWADIQRFLLTESPKHAAMLPEGKLTIGFSAYGIQTNPKRMLATGLSVKKSIKSSGRPVRLVPNPELALNSAQVLHNQLTAERAWELVFVRDGTQTIVAQTTNVQDIDAYAARDQARPARDARVGMLPPKLAQIIMNLATSTVKPNVSQTLLDPFCGTGVVLQEAVLAGYNVYGTDLEERMIRYSRDNLNWLQDKQHTSYEWFLEVGDATSHTWRQPVDTIAGETYLGRPFSALPKPDMLQEVMQDVNLIHKKFLRNVARQTQPGFRLCIAVPAWKTPQGFKHLKTLEILPELGYTRMEFAHASTNQLIYHRENQIVGRELVVLVRK